MHRDEGVDGSPSVSEVYLRCDTAISGAFLQRRKKPHKVMVASPAMASLKRVFWTFGPLLVLSMQHTRVPKTQERPPRLLSPRPVHREH